MATKKKPEEVIEQPKEEQSIFLDAARKVLLATIGAVALAQEEIEDFVDCLIERGEIAGKEGKKLIGEVKDKRKKGTEKAEEELNKRIENVLSRMSVPSKADIESLSEKITALSKKIDELKKA